MHNPAEDILYGEPRKLPQHLHPEIENQKLAVKVTVRCRDEDNNPTSETYETTIEHGCRNCEFGPNETNTEPCIPCYKQFTPEVPYKMWMFDKNYHPCDEYYN